MNWLDLLNKARENPAGIRFDEACELAEAYGWTRARQRGSHVVFKRQGVLELMNLQAGAKGMAKAYQVRQLVRAIDRTGAK